METLRRVSEIRGFVAASRAQSASIGFVPTMGALHAGHLALVQAARARCQSVIVSIFVNPTQFGPNEDFATYPRDEAGDARKLSDAGVDVLYMPDASEMYGEGFSTSVRVKDLSQGLCGDFRPVHFEGVATVVTKLLLQVLPDAAFFGEKDYQQLQIIKRLVRDLNIPVRIESVPTLREGDGLALSSRNLYLSPDERKIAPSLYRILKLTAEDIRGGQAVKATVERAIADLRVAGFAKIDYLEVRDAQSLEPVAKLTRPARLLAAVWLGRTRLIDTVAIETP
ncbi:MAG: pantoate--beta-alanine ligase [Alphaproteobacteria bacterium]